MDLDKFNREWFTDAEILECEIDFRRARRQRIEQLSFAIAWVIAAGAVLLYGLACSAPAKVTTVEKVVPVVTVKRCADKAPPAFARVPRPTTCATGMLCFPIPDAATLAENVERLKEWVLTTWSLCAPSENQ